jgi:hypothetical protein
LFKVGSNEGPYICTDIWLFSFQHIISELNYQDDSKMVSFSLARLLRTRIRFPSKFPIRTAQPPSLALNRMAIAKNDCQHADIGWSRTVAASGPD